MTLSRAERVNHVLAGVLRQCLRDARAPGVRICGSGDDADFVREVCVATLGSDAFHDQGLRLHPANKTALLLGGAPAADILLLGDLYYSQVAELAGSASLPPEVMKLANDCGGPEVLDRALTLHFDQRALWQDAVSELPPSAREGLKEALEVARYHRAHVGLVPKIGSRTLGIDLYA